MKKLKKPYQNKNKIKTNMQQLKTKIKQKKNNNKMEETVKNFSMIMSFNNGAISHNNPLKLNNPLTSADNF